jgi:hypothetical protein
MEHISRKKIIFPVSRSFRKYLRSYGRESKLPVAYDTLKHFSGSIPLYDLKGKDTLWESVYYQPSVTDEIHKGLKRIYSLLKSSGYTLAEEHLHIERIDLLCFW